MKEHEKKYYEQVRNNPKDFIFDRLFTLDENNNAVPIPGVIFRLIGDIPYIEDTAPLKKPDNKF